MLRLGLHGAVFLPFWLWAGVSPLLSGAVADNTLKGDTWCGNLMCVGAVMNGANTTYALTSKNQLGWMAIGFGTAMADAAMVIVWPNSDGSVTLSQRNATGLVEPLPDPSPPHVADLLSSFIDLTAITPTISFSIAANNDAIQNLIWAYGVTPPDSANPDVNIQQHQDSGTLTLDLTRTLDTSSSSSPPSTTTSQTPSPSSSPGATSTPIPSRSPRYHALILAHAILCTLGFMVLLPLAALFARWGRVYTSHWFRTHWTLNFMLSMPVIFVGFVLAPLAVVEGQGTHLQDAHQITGVVVFLVYLAQCSLGLWISRHKPKPGQGQHPPRNILHIVLGVSTLGLTFYVTRTGLSPEWELASSAPPPAFLADLWIIWLSVFFILYSAGYVLLRRQLIQERLGFSLPLLAETPPMSRVATRTNAGEGMSSSAGLGRFFSQQEEDDGTHGIYSERDAPPAYAGIEMRQMTAVLPISVRPLAASPPSVHGERLMNMVTY